MKYVGKTLTVFLIALLLAGCNTTAGSLPTAAPDIQPSPVGTAEIVPVQLPALEGSWKITMTKSGGLMGLSQQVEIVSSGDAKLTDIRTNKASSFQVSEAEISALRDLVASSKYNPPGATSSCADCYLYDLNISTSGEEFQVQVVQVDLPNSGLMPLVDFLSVFINRAVK